jgi:hypothetical protein
VADRVTGQQSYVLLGLATLLLAGSRVAARPRRAAIAVLILATTFVLSFSLPFDFQHERRMGDFGTYTSTHESFVAYTAKAGVRLEAHLSHLTLAYLDQWLGANEDTPRRAFIILSRLGALLFVAALGFQVMRERASMQSVRFAALAIAAPATMMLFEFKELGHLALPWAALSMPMLLSGIEGDDAHPIATGSALAGVGAGFHGFGLLTLAGAASAIAVYSRPWRRMLLLLALTFAFGTASYLIWLFIDLTALGLPITPGHANGIQLRPLLQDVAGERRVNAAVFSALGRRDILYSAWLVGVPVMIVVAVLARRDIAARLALAVSVPSLIWLIAFWPIQGVGAELDLVFGAFPAIYALLWVCARDLRATLFAAVLVGSGHLAFWRVLLDDDFVNKAVF